MPSLFNTTRTRSQILLIVCVLLVVVQSTFAASAINPATYCAPGQAINPRQCATRIKKCRAYGAIMKFTGPGCRNSRGKPVGDGGCQCSSYCAYSCSKPCVRDRQCYWNSTAAACFVKATNTIGAPILSCVPTHSPTTARPSQEPTMRTSIPTASPSSSPSSNPTMSPITTQPSKSPSAIPTTSKPSMTPSQTPSRIPSRAPSGTPSKAPSRSPSRAPSNNPSRGPSSIPSTIPSGTPSKAPSRAPSRAPSKTPSRTPSRTPSKLPSKTPSRIPSRAPSKAPSQTPSQTPSTSPSDAPVLVTCDLTTDSEVTGIWLDGVDILSSVTPSGESTLNDSGIAKQITFEVNALSTSQTIAMSGRALEATSSNANSGFTFICRSNLLVWTFQTSTYENWEGLNGPTFPQNWQTRNGTSVGTLRSTSRYCLNIAPYSEGCSSSANKYDIVKIWPVVASGSGDPLQGIRKTIDSTTPNYMMKLGRMVLMPPTTGSMVILYSIGNTKSFRIINTGTAGNLCIFNEPAGTISRCYFSPSRSTLFFFAFSGTSAAGFDDSIPPALVGIPLFSSFTFTGVIYLMDDENLCFNQAGDPPPTPATFCIIFSAPGP